MDRSVWTRAAFAIAAATLWSFACTTNEPGQPACVPGRSLDCTCIDGRPGAQVCADDGNAFGPCVCGSNPDASANNDATLEDANAEDVSPSDDVAPASDGTVGDAGAIDATDAAPSDFGTPTAACSFTVASPYLEVVSGVASGPSGRIAAVGNFYANVDAGGAPIDFGDGTKITTTDGSTNPLNGGFVFTLDTSCKIVWARAIEFGDAVAFDSKGNIWTASVRDGSAIVSIVTKFDPLGNVLFQTAFGSDSGHVQIQRIAIDATDAVILGGEYAFTPSFGGNPLPYNNTAPFVVKLSSNGTHIWSKGFGGTKSCPRQPHGLALDPSGDVLIVGDFGNVDCDISFGGAQFTATGLDWAFAARLSGADGSHVWSEALQSADLFAACVTGSGSIFTGGLLTAARDFGSGVINGGPFIAKLAPDAGGVWGEILSADHIVCGGELGERAIALSSPYTQVVENDGGLGWSFNASSDRAYLNVASGANRDILFGGYLRPNNNDVYVLRLTR